MIFILIFNLLSIKCLEEAAYGFKTIRSAADQSLYVSSFDKIFRLRKTMDPVTGLESNVVKFVALENGYKIVVNDEPMCVASHLNANIVSCDLIPEAIPTTWSIEETPHGISLRTAEGTLCLSGGAFDDRDTVDGYELTVEKCDSSQAGLWIIRPIETLVANGDLSEKAQDLGNNGRNPSITDFVDHNPGSNITTGWQPEDKSAIELPESINGFN